MSTSEFSSDQAETLLLPRGQAVMVAIILVSATLLALAGIDLVLPAIPELPSILIGTPTEAQLVLATFAAGAGFGLLLFGELGARFDHRRMLAIALGCYGLFSFIAIASDSLAFLIVLRFFQGLSASCAAVVAPGMIRAMFSEKHAMGALSSVESLAPAIAPIIGLWLFSLGGWTASFLVTAVLATLLALTVFSIHDRMPDSRRHGSQKSDKNFDSSVRAAFTSRYLRLMRHWPYLRYSMSQAFALGGLLVFVFGAPVAMIGIGGGIRDFIMMQICGVTSFIIAANLAGILADKFGTDKTIWLGTILCLIGALSIFIYTLGGGNQPGIIWILFVPMNMGLGFRAPTSFYKALVEADGDDARASALLILSAMLITALGTAVTAVWIDLGFWFVAIASAVLMLCSAICFAVRSRPYTSNLEKDSSD